MSASQPPRPLPRITRRFPALVLSLLLLALLSPCAHANYGQEPKELIADHERHPDDIHPDPNPKQPTPVAKSIVPPQTIATGPIPATDNQQTNNDDSNIRADDTSFQKLASEREQLAHKLSEIDRLRSKMLSKSELLKRVRALKGNVDTAKRRGVQVRKEESIAEQKLSIAVQRKNATWDQKEAIARQRRSIEKLLEEIRTETRGFEDEIKKIDHEKKRIGQVEQNLESEREKLLRTVRGLVSQFRERGMHTWLERHLSQLPPVMRETIVKASTVLDPVIQGVEDATELTGEVSVDTTNALTRYLPSVRDSPFYTGLIFYVILLCPTVAAAWLMLKIRARLSQMTVEHYLIAINLYFGVMSAACAVMSLLSRTDILIVFRHRSRHLAESFMIIHGFLFVLHLVLHGMTAYVTGARKDFAQYISMSCVGLHFFMNAYKRTILNEDPNIGTVAYLFYAATFLYTLYDRGVHIIEAAIKGRKANASAFNTFPTDPVVKSLPNGAGPPNGDSTVYFAGLPVFNRPSQSSVDDAKTI